MHPARGLRGRPDLLRVRRAASIRWIRERSFPTAIELLDWYHLVEALRRAIGDGRPDRLETALAVVAPGDAERLGELLAGWAYEEAGLDLDRSGKLAAWAADNAGGNVTTDEFIALAESISGQDLRALFDTWLFTSGKPDTGAAAVSAGAAATNLGNAPRVARSQLQRYGANLSLAGAP